MKTFINHSKTGVGKVIAIFWTINDPPGLQGLMHEASLGDMYVRTIKTTTIAKITKLKTRMAE